MGNSRGGRLRHPPTREAALVSLCAWGEGRSLKLPETLHPALLHERGVVLWASGKVSQCLGYHSLRGRYLSALVAPRDTGTLSHALENPGRCKLRLAVRNAAGGYLRVEAHALPTKFKGRPVQWVVVSFLGEDDGDEHQ